MPDHHASLFTKTIRHVQQPNTQSLSYLQQQGLLGVVVVLPWGLRAQREPLLAWVGVAVV